MSAPFRWTIALVAVGALGFVAGQFLGRERYAPAEAVSFPVVAPAGSSTAGSPELSRGLPKRVPTTIREILKLPGDFTQTTALYVLAESQDQEGIERLLAEAKSIDRPSEMRAASSILYERYAEIDPEAAVEHMTRDGRGFDPNWLYGVFHSWARVDLDAAVARASKLDDRARQMVATAIVRSRDDLPAEDRAALGLKMNAEVSLRDSTSSDLSSPKAAERAWQSALAMGDGRARYQELYNLAGEWARHDPQAAIRAIESLRDRGQRDQLLETAIHAWAGTDLEQAVGWILERPPSQQRTQFLAGTLSAVVRTEPATAMAVAERLGPAERTQVMPQLVMTWAMINPQAAIAWMEKQDDRQVYSDALSMVAHVYAMRDPDGALRWAESLTGDDARMVKEQVIRQIAESDPERASSLIGQINEGPDRDSAMAEIAQAWASSDPRAALSWVAKQPRSEGTPELYRAVFGQWSIYDPDGAVSQLNFILESDTRNAAIQGILSNPYLNVGLIEPLYQRIEGAEARRVAAEHVYYRMLQVDPRAAERYRRDSGIDEQGNVGTIVVN